MTAWPGVNMVEKDPGKLGRNQEGFVYASAQLNGLDLSAAMQREHMANKRCLLHQISAIEYIGFHFHIVLVVDHDKESLQDIFQSCVQSDFSRNIILSNY